MALLPHALPLGLSATLNLPAVAENLVGVGEKIMAMWEGVCLTAIGSALRLDRDDLALQ